MAKKKEAKSKETETKSSNEKKALLKLHDALGNKKDLTKTLHVGGSPVALKFGSQKYKVTELTEDSLTLEGYSFNIEREAKYLSRFGWK